MTECPARPPSFLFPQMMNVVFWVTFCSLWIELNFTIKHWGVTKKGRPWEQFFPSAIRHWSEEGKQRQRIVWRMALAVWGKLHYLTMKRQGRIPVFNGSPALIPPASTIVGESFQSRLFWWHGFPVSFLASFVFILGKSFPCYIFFGAWQLLKAAGTGPVKKKERNWERERKLAVYHLFPSHRLCWKFGIVWRI